MKKKTKTKFIFSNTALFILIVLDAVILITGIVLYDTFSMDWVFPPFIVLFFSIISLVLLLYIVRALVPFNIKKRLIKIVEKNKLHSTLPLEPINDFKVEIDKTRQNYEQNKETFFVREEHLPKIITSNVRDFLDLSVFDTGKICYGCLVQANNALFAEPANKDCLRIFPAVALYSLDEYYDSNPIELMKIAYELFQNKENNILRDEYGNFSNLLVPKELTNGRLFTCPFC